MLVPTGALIAVGLTLTVLAGPIIGYSDRAAAEVLDRDRYISAVLGGGAAMRSRLLRAWVLCWLMLVWVLLWGKATPANIIGGFAVALVITLLLPLPAVPVEGRLHPLSLAQLVVVVALPVGAVLAAGGLAGGQAGTATAHGGAARAPGAQVGSGAGVAVNVINLIPGSIVLEIDQARRLIYVHVIDAGSDHTVGRFYHQVAEWSG